MTSCNCCLAGAHRQNAHRYLVSQFGIRNDLVGGHNPLNRFLFCSQNVVDGSRAPRFCARSPNRSCWFSFSFVDHRLLGRCVVHSVTVLFFSFPSAHNVHLFVLAFTVQRTWRNGQGHLGSHQQDSCQGRTTPQPLSHQRLTKKESDSRANATITTLRPS